MAGSTEWVLLAYRLPREPSTPRIAVWRRLRRLGALQLQDGLVALPADARTKEHLEWVADDVVAADGEAEIWLARPGSRGHERSLANRMAEAVAVEYQGIQAEAEEAMGEPPSTRRRVLARLKREMQRVQQRDHFPGSERERAMRRVTALAARVDEEVAR